MQTGAARCRLPRRFIVPLPAAVSRSLPPVASYAIGFAEPRHGFARKGPAPARKTGEK